MEYFSFGHIKFTYFGINSIISIFEIGFFKQGELKVGELKIISQKKTNCAMVAKFTLEKKHNSL